MPTEPQPVANSVPCYAQSGVPPCYNATCVAGDGCVLLGSEPSAQTADSADRER